MSLSFPSFSPAAFIQHFVPSTDGDGPAGSGLGNAIGSASTAMKAASDQIAEAQTGAADTYTVQHSQGNYGPNGTNASSTSIYISNTNDHIAVSSVDKKPTAWFVSGNQSASVTVDGKTASLHNENGKDIKMTDLGVPVSPPEGGPESHEYRLEMDNRSFTVFVSPLGGDISVIPDRGNVTDRGFSLYRSDSTDKASVSSSIFHPGSDKVDSWNCTSPLQK